MKISVEDWDEDMSEFHILPMLCIVKQELVVSIQFGWLFWIYDFTIVL